MIRLLRDIAASYLRPGTVIAQLKARNPGEEQLLAFVMFACLFGFVTQLPDILAKVAGDPSGNSPALNAGATLVGAMIFAPLFFYFVAGISHLIVRIMGGNSGWYDARLALFWSLLAIQPAVILAKIMSTFLPVAALQPVISAVLAALFAFMWISGLRRLQQD